MDRALAKSKAEAIAIVTNALMKLGVARRERLDDKDYDVYREGLQQFPAELVAAVCRELAGREVEEYAPRFPTLGTIRQGCIDKLRRAQEDRELNTRKLTEGGERLTPERHRAMLEQFKAILREKQFR